jgi:hypothetical protein
MDPAKLSKEELLALLKQREEEHPGTTPAVGEELRCCFAPQRTNQPPCPEKVICSYGGHHFCRKHSRTVQALNAKENFEKQRLEEAERRAEEEKSKTRAAHSEPKHTPAKKTASVAPPTTIVKKYIRKNNWGNYEDTETHIVFDRSTKSAYGVQDHTTGQIRPLTERHIRICKRNQWPYRLPRPIEFDDDGYDEDDEDEGEEMTKMKKMTKMRRKKMRMRRKKKRMRRKKMRMRRKKKRMRRMKKRMRRMRMRKKKRTRRRKKRRRRRKKKKRTRRKKKKTKMNNSNNSLF